MSSHPKYSFNISWSDEDKCFVATCSEFPGLSAFGETQAEAAQEAEIALEGFIEVFKEDGCPLPEPEVLQTCSGQTRLRMPISLHTSLKNTAKKEGVSLNTWIVSLLTTKLSYYNVLSALAEQKEKIDQSVEVLSDF